MIQNICVLWWNVPARSIGVTSELNTVVVTVEFVTRLTVLALWTSEIILTVLPNRTKLVYNTTAFDL